jgi:creatinine amidohydrolase/Fe(II)-dependent formamide hydrolase-like protein
MNLLHMNPEEIQAATARKVPVLLPVGAVEYHGPHLPVGTDTLIAQGLCEKIAEQAEVVVAPAIPFSPTLHWAGGVRSGDVDFGQQAFAAYAQEYIRQLAAMGFQRIYALVGHQGKEGLPALILKQAGWTVAAELAQALGEGWSLLPPGRWPLQDMFGLVRVCGYDEFSEYAAINRGEPLPVGHGGRGETQLIMALYKGFVNMDALQGQPLPPWLADVHQADLADGEFWVDFCVRGFVDHFSGRGPGV